MTNETLQTNQQIHDHLQQGLKEGEVRLHNRFHPTRWKKGFASYHFHRHFEYEIMEKGQHSDAKYKTHKRWRNVGKNHILIRPISIGESKQTSVLGVDITQYQFWIARHFIRRGPNSWSIKKNRWIMKQVFDFCLNKAIKGDVYWQNPFTRPFRMKNPYR